MEVRQVLRNGGRAKREKRRESKLEVLGTGDIIRHTGVYTPVEEETCSFAASGRKEIQDVMRKRM